jgi:hypothetical protein
MSLPPRVVAVHRRSELDELVDRHGTRGQAAFFLRSRGRDLGEVQARHDAVARARRVVAASVPSGWRTGSVERSDLDRFAFDPEDLVVAVGQDGLVANVAKYLDGQPVIGVDPEPGRNPGVLVPHRADAVGPVLLAAAAGTAAVVRRTMVRVETDDGEHVDALNEIFVGHPSHQSARYRLRVGGRDERQSSSGLVVGTGTGATGWCSSLALGRPAAPTLPGPQDRTLAWFVREAWPSPVSGTALTEGLLGPDGVLEVLVETDGLVAFGDGVEPDRLTLGWGQTLRLRASDRTLVHVTGR